MSLRLGIDSRITYHDSLIPSSGDFAVMFRWNGDIPLNYNKTLLSFLDTNSASYTMKLSVGIVRDSSGFSALKLTYVGTGTGVKTKSVGLGSASTGSAIYFDYDDSTETFRIWMAFGTSITSQSTVITGSNRNFSSTLIGRTLATSGESIVWADISVHELAVWDNVFDNNDLLELEQYCLALHSRKPGLIFYEHFGNTTNNIYRYGFLGNPTYTLIDTTAAYVGNSQPPGSTFGYNLNAIPVDVVPPDPPEEITRSINSNPKFRQTITTEVTHNAETTVNISNNVTFRVIAIGDPIDTTTVVYRHDLIVDEEIICTREPRETTININDTVTLHDDSGEALQEILTIGVGNNVLISHVFNVPALYLIDINNDFTFSDGIGHNWKLLFQDQLLYIHEDYIYEYPTSILPGGNDGEVVTVVDDLFYNVELTRPVNLYVKVISDWAIYKEQAAQDYGS